MLRLLIILTVVIIGGGTLADSVDKMLHVDLSQIVFYKQILHNMTYVLLGAVLGITVVSHRK